MIYCFATHSASIRTIPALQHDMDKPEDINTEGEDHAGDDWRYACMSRPWAPVPIKLTTAAKVGYAAKRPAGPSDWRVY